MLTTGEYYYPLKHTNFFVEGGEKNTDINNGTGNKTRPESQLYIIIELSRLIVVAPFVQDVL